MYCGIGKTTIQMKATRQGGYFVWWCTDLSYPNHLKKEIGRDDITIVSAEWLENYGCRGVEVTDIVVDHYTKMTEAAFIQLQILRSRIHVRTQSANDAQ